MPILAAVDKDPGIANVIETAAEVATALDQELIVLHVVPESEDVDKARAQVEEIVAETLGDREYTLRVTGESSGSARKDMPSGRMANTVLRIAEDLDASYLVLGSRKRTPVGKVMLGSVAQLILVNADMPVITVEQAK